MQTHDFYIKQKKVYTHKYIFKNTTCVCLCVAVCICIKYICCMLQNTNGHLWRGGRGKAERAKGRAGLETSGESVGK